MKIFYLTLFVSFSLFSQNAKLISGEIKYNKDGITAIKHNEKFNTYIWFYKEPSNTENSIYAIELSKEELEELKLNLLSVFLDNTIENKRIVTENYVFYVLKKENLIKIRVYDSLVFDSDYYLGGQFPLFSKENINTLFGN